MNAKQVSIHHSKERVQAERTDDMTGVSLYFFKFKFIFIFNMYERFVCAFVYAPLACLVLRGQVRASTSWNWS